MRKTKIICTIGPASTAPEVMSKMVEVGMNVARINFSHATMEERKAVVSGRLVRVHINSAGSVDLNGDFVCDSPLNGKIKQSKLKFAQEIEH